ncbi:MAG: hypothetical protein KKE02_14280 [Alphaproteobacteria bacterium]|nr:hypothetical protein [Alphaproteobacteria bacterium]MBU1513159.1 hypothetical protein [Alphaproteobacteria bacterium]MBU2095267.1 hypothetical protein [Alphaproteobacteria bacterium]MBU2152182.1 hypothetical protein [Alphaproteobacteria bacterium]MBU2306771.1 hypothetical protein [Alphaproteobacteria bacterium]
MLAGLRQFLVNPATGLVAIAVAISLAVALGVVSADWRSQAARYESRIAELTQAAEKAEAGFRMELASCQAAGEARQTREVRISAPGGTSPGARRLLEQQPEGIDACARMESADQAVLSNLKK